VSSDSLKLYGLTGGPGMGKTAAAEWLAREGVPVVDTDAIAREVVNKGEPGLEAVVGEFGSQVIDAEGGLDRAALAGLVFAKAEARGRLEAILHPLIRERWMKVAEEWRATGVKAGVVVIPLLFETGAEQEFERVICIGCSPRLQSARLHQRGWNAEQVAGRLSAQWPIEKKMDRSHFVIWNDSSVEVMREQLGRVPPLKGSE
jgi:dephospho-CoA kinase